MCGVGKSVSDVISPVWRKQNNWIASMDPSTKWWKPGRPPFFGTRHPRCHGVPTEGLKTGRKTEGGGGGNSVIDARYKGG